VQSLFVLHCTQLPAASQTFPAPAVHAVPTVALETTHMPAVHATVLHCPGFVQSEFFMQTGVAVQLPAPSHVIPVPQGWPWLTSFVTSMPAAHDGTMHGFMVGCGPSGTAM
jgi:hypothetical protein